MRPHVHLVAWPCAHVWQKMERSVLSMLSVSQSVCVSVCVCVSPACQRYETARTSTVDHRECPEIKPPPTFCLLLRALDRARPRTMDRAQCSNWGF